jgi:hypothetical protein
MTMNAFITGFLLVLGALAVLTGIFLAVCALFLAVERFCTKNQADSAIQRILADRQKRFNESIKRKTK